MPTPSEKISTPPEKFPTPTEKISTLPEKISTPPEKISTPPPPEISQSPPPTKISQPSPQTTVYLSNIQSGNHYFSVTFENQSVGHIVSVSSPKRAASDWAALVARNNAQSRQSLLNMDIMGYGLVAPFQSTRYQKAFRSADTFATFKKSLKTHLYIKCSGL